MAGYPRETHHPCCPVKHRLPRLRGSWDPTEMIWKGTSKGDLDAIVCGNYIPYKYNICIYNYIYIYILYIIMLESISTWKPNPWACTNSYVFHDKMAPVSIRHPVWWVWYKAIVVGMLWVAHRSLQFTVWDQRKPDLWSNRNILQHVIWLVVQ